jgi:protein TonB
LAAVITAKIDIVRKEFPPTMIDLIPEPEKPTPPENQPKRRPTNTTYTAPTPPLALPPQSGPTADPLPPDPLPPLPPGTGTGTSPQPPQPTPMVRSGPRFATPSEDIRPPYPESMRAAEREAVLRLKLSIDEGGHVVAVDPVGKADPAFLAAARRHILKVWRYRPAMEGDRAIASSTVITLEFKLD